MKYFYIIFFLSIVSSAYSQQFRLLRPVPDTIQTNGSYLYGEPNINNPLNAHRGLDILVRYDTVYSASDGLVEFVGYNPNDTIGGYEPGGGGNYIRIKSQWNSKNIYLYYMHLTKPVVSQGNNVLTGQPIAISGNTGNSTGPHLHFEIRINTSDFGALRSRRNAELWIGISGMGAIYGHVPNAPVGGTRVDISPDPKPRPPYTTFGWALTYNFNDIYIGSDDIYNENYAIGDVKPGTYTITALNGTYHRVVTVGAGQVVDADPPSGVDEELIAEGFSLKQNYPNPFNPVTVITFQIPERGFIKLKIYDLLGREITELVNEERDAGVYNESFTALDLPSGMYIYSLIVQSTENDKVYSDNKKMLLIK